MITLQIKEKKYEMPSALDELTIDHYQKVMALENRESLEQMIKVISIISNIEEDLIKQLDADSVRTINYLATSIFSSKPYDFQQTFVLDNVTYEFDSNFSKMSIGKFSDLTKLSEPELVNQNLHTIMALLYVPTKEPKQRTLLQLVKQEKVEKVTDYDEEEVQARAELFKEKLTMNIVLGCVLFTSLLHAAVFMSEEGASDEEIEKKIIEKMESVMLKM